MYKHHISLACCLLSLSVAMCWKVNLQVEGEGVRKCERCERERERREVFLCAFVYHSSGWLSLRSNRVFVWLGSDHHVMSLKKTGTPNPICAEAQARIMAS
jgi:hypothetical protein